MLTEINNYLHEIKKAKEEHSSSYSLVGYLGSFLPWYKSLQPDRSSVDDELPWMPFSIISYLDRSLTDQMRVFEYGCGGSTLFFAHRVKEVIAVEHNLEWCNNLTDIFRQRNINNARVEFRSPSPTSDWHAIKSAEMDSYISSAQEFQGYSFNSYASYIDKFPDGYFDVILVDGRARPSCFKHAISKLKSSGMMILDDSEREDYHNIISYSREHNWSELINYGPVPYKSYFSQTICWVKSIK